MHMVVIGAQEATASMVNKTFSLEYHNIKLLGKRGFGTVSLVERTSASCSDGKRELFAMKRVVKRASKKAGSRRIIEKEVFKNADGHPFLAQLHTYFETVVLHSF